MKAITIHKYGSPQEMQLQDVDMPDPKPGEVLVKNFATSINSWDADMVSGKPRIYRLLFGLLKPKYPIIGIDVAGIVEQVGEGVVGFAKGDRVMGDACETSFGAFAQYVTVSEKQLYKISEDVRFEDAASIAHSAQMAYQAVYELRELKPREQLLLNGAGGCVGSFLIPMAKHLGAEVTCVDSSEKEPYIRELGADHFIDYRTEDFTKNGKQYNLIVDLVSNRSVYEYTKSLKADGILKVVGGKVGSLLSTAIVGGIMSKFSDRTYGMLVHKPMANTDKIMRLYQYGVFKPSISKIFSLEQLPKALDLITRGVSFGKLVIKIPHN